MKKIFFLFFLFLFGFVFADFSELSVFGYPDMVFSSDSCKELLLEANQKNIKEKKFFVATLGIARPGDSKFKLKFFEDDVFSFLLTEKDLFNCSDSKCTAIAELNPTKKVERLKICAFLSSETNKLTIYNSSLYGFFRTGEVLPENFRVAADNYSPKANEDVRITVSALNTGLMPLTVTLLSQNKKLADKNIRIVFGDASFYGVLQPNQKLSFSFSVRMKTPGFIGMPPAILYYTDSFGRQHKIFSNLLSFTVLPSTPNVLVEFNSSGVVKQNSTADAKIVLKNRSLNEAKNIKIELKPVGKDIVLTGPTSFFVASVEPNSFLEKSFSFSSKTLGKKRIDCYLEFVESGEKKRCPSLKVFVEEKETSFLPLAVLMLVLSAIVYIFIQR